MATYYVDFTTGNDSDSGLTEALAWKTIAKVQASTFSPGDIVKFKRGEQWREQFTFGLTDWGNLQIAGTALSPITFEEYGDSATVTTSRTLSTDWSAYTSDDALYGPVTGQIQENHRAECARLIISGANACHSWTNKQVKCQFESDYYLPFNITACYIGEQSSTGDVFDMEAGTITQLPINSSTDPYLLGSQDTVWTDLTNYSFDPAKTYVISFGIGGLDSYTTAWPKVWKVTGGAFYQAYSAYQKAGDADLGTLGTDVKAVPYSRYGLKNVTFSGNYSNVWRKTGVTGITAVTFNGTTGTQVSQIRYVNSANKWSGGEGTLYIYSVGTPVNIRNQAGTAITGFTEFTSVGEYIMFGPVTGDFVTMDQAGYCYRTPIPNQYLSHNGSQVRVRFKALEWFPLDLASVYIGEQAVTGNTWDMKPGTITQLTFDVGSSTVTINAQSTKWTDWVTYAFDASKNYIIAFKVGSAPNDGVTTWNWLAHEKYLNSYWKAAGDPSVAVEAGYSWTEDGGIVSFGFDEIAVRGTFTNVWKCSGIGNKPDRVLFDSAAGTEVTSIAALTSVKKWYWDNRCLYIYCTGSPPSVYSTTGVVTQNDDTNEPIITGMDVVTGWSTYSQTFNSNLASSAETWDEWQDVDYTYRILVPPETFSVDADHVVVTFKSAQWAGVPMPITAAYIGQRADSGEPYNFEAGTVVQLLFGGLATKTIAGGDVSFASDSMAMPIDRTKAYIVSLQIQGTPDSGSGCKVWVEGYSWYKAGNDAATVTSSGYTDADFAVYGVADVAVSFSLTDVWRASCADDSTHESPNTVLFDGSLGNRAGTIRQLSENYKWFWEADYLYVRSSADPDTAYVLPGIEASRRRQVLLMWGYDDVDAPLDPPIEYIEFNNIKFRYSNQSTLEVQGCPHISVDGIDVMRAGLHNAYLNESPDFTAVDSNFHEALGQHGMYLNKGCHRASLTHCDFYKNERVGVSINPNEGIEIEDIIISKCRAWENRTGFSSIGTDGWQLLDNLMWDNTSFNLFLSYNSSEYPGHEVTCRNSHIYNNVLVCAGKTCARNIYIERYTDANLIKNNIFYGTTNADPLIEDGRVDGDTELNVIDYNCFYAGGGSNKYFGDGAFYNTLSSWLVATGYGLNNIEGDPGFVDVLGNDYALASIDSICIDAGVDVGLTTDYLGVVIYGVPDIGAYEFAANHFLREESRQTGAQPIFKFTIFPHFFKTGIDGLGTFVNCIYVEADKEILVVDDNDTHAAAWTSAVLSTPSGEYPCSVLTDWEFEDCGYYGTVEYRTSTTTVLLAGKAWTTVVSGETINLYEFYQWRAIWLKKRCWAVDTLLDPDPYSTAAWASEVVEVGLHDSVAVDGTGDAYLTDMILEGVYTIGSSDIMDAGSIGLERPVDFSDITAGEHTLVLNNRAMLYSPNKSTFAFLSDMEWYRKKIKVEMTYAKATALLPEDYYLLYVGTILSWGPIQRAMDSGGQLLEHTCELYSRDYIAHMLEKKIGIPDDNGNPQPLLYGELLVEGTHLADKPLSEPFRTAYFNKIKLSELSRSTSLNGGAFSFDSTDPYEGVYSLQCNTTLANASVVGYMYAGLNETQLFCSMAIRWDVIPDTILLNNMVFFQWVDSAGASIVKFVIQYEDNADGEADGKVWMYSSVTGWKETDWNIRSNEGVCADVSFWLKTDGDGKIMMWVDGDEVCKEVQNGLGDPLNFGATRVHGCQFGISQTLAETWQVTFDNVELYLEYFDECYQATGYPFTSIGTVYRDYIPQESYITKLPALGAIYFSSPDITNPLGGNIQFKVVKNTINHPVDIIADLIDQANLSDYINTASFAAAKALIPLDVIACNFDNQSIADAIRDICSKCLLDLYIDRNEIYISAYIGLEVGSSSMALDNTILSQANQVVDMEDLRNIITTTWGWYEHNKKLYYKAKNTDSITLIGEIDEELNFQWGESVASESRNTAKLKADYLLTRLVAPKDIVETTGFLKLVRVSLGDGVALTDVVILDAATVYGVYAKEINMMPPYGVNLKLIRFLGVT